MAWLLSLPRCQFISAVHLTFGEGTFSCPFSRGRWLFLSIPPSQAEDLYLPSRNGTVCFPLPSGLRISFVREESLVNRLGFMCVRHTGFSFSVLLLCLQFFFCELSDRNLLYKGFPIILNSQINSHMVLNFFFFYHFSFFKNTIFMAVTSSSSYYGRGIIHVPVFAERGLPLWISFHVSLEPQLLFGLNKNYNFVDYWSFFLLLCVSIFFYGFQHPKWNLILQVYKSLMKMRIWRIFIEEWSWNIFKTAFSSFTLALESILKSSWVLPWIYMNPLWCL